MLDSVKIAKRQSEIRQALAELVGKEKPTEDETRSMETMDAEYRNNEVRYRAALTAEDTERREAGDELETRSDREYAELVGRFELRQIAFALDEGRALSGATKEVVEEMRSKGGFQGIPIPFEALETRAGETVSGADLPNPKAIRPVIDRIFPNSVAAKLGIERINITHGELAFPVATSGAVFGWQTDELSNVGAANPYETAERSLNPDHTGGCQMVITRKALKQSGEGLEAAIRRDLNAVIGAELDRVIISGAGGTEPLGIVPGAAVYGITSTAVGAAASWAAFRAEVVAFMEANAITSPSQVNLAFDPAIWADLDEALIAGTAVSEWDRLTKHVGTPAISNVIPDASAIMTANVQGIAPGYLGLYGGVDLIRDIFTKAASGQLVLTGLVTADFTVPRGLQTRILTGLAA